MDNLAAASAYLPVLVDALIGFGIIAAVAGFVLLLILRGL